MRGAHCARLRGKSQINQVFNRPWEAEFGGKLEKLNQRAQKLVSVRVYYILYVVLGLLYGRGRVVILIRKGLLPMKNSFNF